MAETPSTIQMLIPVVTGAVGLASGVVIEWLRDARAHRRERETRDETRRDARLDRHNEFQRKTLLELQEEALKLMQAAGAFHHCDMMSIRKHGKRRVEPYPEKLDREGQTANAQTALLGVRVTDDEVRRLLKQLKEECTFAALESEAEVRERFIQAAGWRFVQLNDRIGEVLRGIDQIELTA